jgi:hypothetical protein
MELFRERGEAAFAYIADRFGPDQLRSAWLGLGHFVLPRLRLPLWPSAKAPAETAQNAEFGTTSCTSEAPIKRAFTLMGQHGASACSSVASLPNRPGPSWGILPNKKEAHVLSRPDRR